MNNTLQQTSVAYSKTQQTLINSLLKETPFLQQVPFITATHGMWNQFERVTGVSGAGFKEPGAPYIEMDVQTEIERANLGIIGGLMKVNEDKALQLYNISEGAKAATEYFAKRSPTLLNDAGKMTEKTLIYDVIYKALLKHNKQCDEADRTIIDAGGTGSSNWSILAIRQNPEQNCGLLSPLGKNKDELMVMEWLNGGQRHKLSDGTVGYEATWKANIGYQVAAGHHVGAIFNIDPDNDHNVTSAQIDMLLDNINADASDTVLVMHRAMHTKLYSFKTDKMRTENKDKEIDNRYETWNGIRMIGTSNMLRGTESKVVMPWA